MSLTSMAAGGARLHAYTHGAYGLAIACAPSLQHGLQVMTRFGHLRAPHFLFREPVTIGDEVRIAVEDRVPLAAQEQRPLLELLMLSTQAMIEGNLGRPMLEGRFELPYGAPEHAVRYRHYFHAQTRFGCEQAAVVIPSRWLCLPSPFADLALYDASLQQLLLAAPGLHGDRRFIARIEQALAQHGPLLGIRAMARLLGVSDRTLARRLGSHGTSYRALVTASVKNRAVALLHDRSLSVAEVAYAVGYEDGANFGRAFRRWFGASPGKYRAALLSRVEASVEADAQFVQGPFPYGSAG